MSADRQQSTKIRVISYARCSKLVQAKGDTHLRQIERVREYCAKHGYWFDEEASIFDKGKSGFHGDNLTAGLGAFLGELEHNPKKYRQTILAIEDFDRLSRRPSLEVLNLLQSILRYCPVAILNEREQKLLTSEELAEDLGLLIETVVESYRANRESARKQEFSLRAWRKRWDKARSGGVATRNCPGWLAVRDGKFVTLEERADVVKKIFAWRASGVPQARIIRLLHESKTPTFREAKNGWSQGYLNYLFRDRRVIGELTIHKREGGKRVATDEVLQGYFPQIVDGETFWKVQGLLRVREAQPRTIANVFGGLLECPHCKSTLKVTSHYVKSKYRYHYLICDARRRGLVEHEPVWLHSAPVEEKLLSYIGGALCVGDLLGERDGDELQGRISTLAHRISDLEGRVTNLLDALEGEETKKVRDRIKERLLGHEGELERLRHEREELEGELRRREASPASEALSEIRRLTEKMAGLEGEDLYDLRFRLKDRIKTIVRRVTVHSGEEFSISFLTGARMRIKFAGEGERPESPPDLVYRVDGWGVLRGRGERGGEVWAWIEGRGGEALERRLAGR